MTKARSSPAPAVPPLDVEQFAPPQDPRSDTFLGAAIYGRAPQPCGEPCACVCMPTLPGMGETGFAWRAPGPFVDGSIAGLSYRFNRHLLFGAIAVQEQDFPSSEATSALELATHAAYVRVFAAMSRARFRYLARCWNYLPRINFDGGGLERYRQFNIGRQDAFIASHRSHLTGSPAACALGTGEGALVVYFIASHQRPVNIENPRQTSAYRYPKLYGPRAPTFSRASLLALPGCEVFFVSGTASIVGHESVHYGDVVAQTEEIIRNLEVLVEQANLKSLRGAYAVRDLRLKVFVRHAADVPAVAGVLRQSLGEGVDAVYLLADVCREELLVEIEAVAFAGLGVACQP